MAIKIDRELAGNIDNPDLKVISYCIKKHKRELERLQKLSDTYDGDHEVLQRNKKSNNDLTNVMVNNAKYVTDMNLGFMLGNPVAYTPGEGKNINPVIESFDEMGVKKHDRELGKDISVFGYGLEMHYLTLLNDTPVPRIKCIDPRGMFLVTDDTVDGHPLFAVRYIEKFDLEDKSIGYNVEVYTPNWFILYRIKDLEMKEASRLKITRHFYYDVPVVEFRNNEEKQGDFEQAISLINAYNILQSDRINDKEAFIDAILVLYGFSLEEDDGESQEKKELKSDGETVLNAPSKEEGAAVEWLTKTFDESSVDILSKSIEKDIHKVTYTPNLNDESFAGNISGEAMKYKLFGLLQLLVTKTGYFEDGLKRRLQLMQNILNVSNSGVDVSGTRISFKPNLPINTSDVIENVIKAYEAGILPLETLLSWLPDIDDPSEEIEKLKIEIEEKIKRNKELLGQPAPSHNEQDDRPEEEDDE